MGALRNSILSLAALAACATPTAGNITHRVELPILVDGVEVARTSTDYGTSSNCTEDVSLITDATDARVKYSRLVRSCDTNNDGMQDSRTYTNIGRGESEPYREEFVLTERSVYDPASSSLVRRGDRCLVIEYTGSGSERREKKQEVVDCASLAPQAPTAQRQP